MGVDPALLSYRLAGASFYQLSVMLMLFVLFFGIILIIVLPELLYRCSQYFNSHCDYIIILPCRSSSGARGVP